MPNTKCPVSAAWIAVSNVSRSRISPTSMMSGSSRTACFMPIMKSFTSWPISRWLIRHLSSVKMILDRVFQREDVLALVVVDPVEHRGDRGALARAGHARQQDHPLVELAELFEDRRQVQPGEVGDLVVHPPGDQAHVAHLLEDVDAESPASCRPRRATWAKSTPPSRSKISAAGPSAAARSRSARRASASISSSSMRRAVQRPQRPGDRARAAADRPSGAGRSPPA